MNCFRSACLVSMIIGLGGCATLVREDIDALASGAQDRGNIAIYYEIPSDEAFAKTYKTLEATAFFDDLATDLNSLYGFPRDIGVVFSECGEENAFYDPETVEITMCYELLDQYADIFAEEYQSDYGDEVILAGHFTFLHELGHALVDQYQLPIVAQEEDVVDSFAAILLLQTGETEAIMAGIEQFDVDAAEEEEELEELPFWGEHSLSIQRVYNIACLVYGSDPKAHADFVEDDFLPEERAEQCPEEYERAAEGWQKLLADFVK